MSAILYNIIISPIELVVEVVFEVMFRILGQRQTNQGLAVIGVSIAISLLTLPLYRRADAVQQKERDLQKKLSHWTALIKKTFKGDERFMMLQTYWRENGYSPLQALNGSISLLLEIPFFIAAYHFLSHLEVLKGASFGFIKDLGTPDELIHIGTYSLNILPVLMTLINCISSAVYLKGFPLKSKIQTYGMALIFLILLYNSPSGLVVYWTCNNIFSLLKNIFYKLRNPHKVAAILCAVLGSLLFTSVIMSGILNSRKKLVVMVLFEITMLIPLIIYYMKNQKGIIFPIVKMQNNSSKILFLLEGMFLTILTGILIPSAVIASSPAEFVDLQNYKNPLLYLINSTCYAAGFFILWAGIIRHMIPKNRRSVLDMTLWIASSVFLMNYMCFGKNLGVLSQYFIYEKELAFSNSAKLMNLAVVAGLSVIMIFIFKFKKIVSMACFVLFICTGILSLSHVFKAQKLLNDMDYIKDLQNKSFDEPLFTFSKKGKNVLVFMLDRAINGYIPYIFEEKPELKKQFSGFTYYPNTLSYGCHTNTGGPAVFGGYEYTVTEINKRDKELLVDKHNEALKLMPLIFSNNNYDVTICDPPYAGYKWIPDISIFDDIPNVHAHRLNGILRNDSLLYFDESREVVYRRNFFVYSIFKVLPLLVSETLYDDGEYFLSLRRIYPERFIKAYSVITLLKKLTAVNEGFGNYFISISNEAAHEPVFLQLPDYILAEKIDNSNFKTAADGHIEMDGENMQAQSYHVNVASLMALGKWFDFMRENGVYDNTRIILVADHGYMLGQFDYMLMKNPLIDVEAYNPLLMVKDFGTTEFSVSNEFMTNADVPTLAVKDIIENPINPFTGKLISNDEKSLHPQIITSSHHFDVVKNNGTTFDTSDGHWFSVHDDIFKEENWKQLD